jgi:hypothetical protein
MTLGPQHTMRGAGARRVVGDPQPRAQVNYVVTLRRRHRLNVSGGTSVENSITGHLTGIDFSDLVGREVIIDLHDGRRWRCLVADLSGRVEDAGGFEGER